MKVNCHGIALSSSLCVSGIESSADRWFGRTVISVAARLDAPSGEMRLRWGTAAVLTEQIDTCSAVKT